jgi:hypothetical protein
LVVVYANINGSLSPRGLGIVLALVCVAGFIGFWAALVRIGRKTASTQFLNDQPIVDAAMRKKLIREIRFCRVGIAFLVLCLIFAVAGSKGAPVPPLMVGVTMNLLFTTSLILRIRQLKRLLAEGQAVDTGNATTQK